MASKSKPTSRGCGIILTVALIVGLTAFVTAMIVDATFRNGIIVTFGVLFILAVFFAWREDRKDKRVRALVGGRPVFVYKRNRGWNEFVTNNVLAQLDPTTVYVLCKPPPRRMPARRPDDTERLKNIVNDELSKIRTWPSVPFVVSLRSKNCDKTIVTPLHEALLPRKPFRRRDSQVQALIRPILAEAFRRHGLDLDGPA
jgi:hypothetical protein